MSESAMPPDMPRPNATRRLRKGLALGSTLVSMSPTTASMLLLVEWLTSQISGSDMRFAAFVREKNRE